VVSVPEVDYAAVASGLSKAIPFNVHLGLQTVSVSPSEGVVELPQDDRLHNHVGSQHAGALFSAGEAASGAAFVGAFLDIMGEITPLAQSAEISYLKIAKGRITATASFDEDAESLRETLSQEGRVRFPVKVSLTDGAGDVVAEMTVRWYVRRNDAA